MKNKKEIKLLYIFFISFLLSGFCALVYQVIWLRLTYASFGINSQILSIIISVFMLGLAIGSWSSSKIIKWSKKIKIDEIKIYATAELLIGLSALIVPRILIIGNNILLNFNEINSFTYFLYSGLFITIIILPWTILMGMTIPVIMGFLKRKNVVSYNKSFSYLYLANTIGAIIGVALSAIVLIELLGFANTLLITSLINFSIASFFLFIFPKYFDLPEKHDLIINERNKNIFLPLDSQKRRLILWLLFFTGFISMGLEVVWTRVFTPVLGTTIYAFAIVLLIYLLGTCIGSWRYRYKSNIHKELNIVRILFLLILISFGQLIMNDPRINLGGAGIIISVFIFSFILGYLTPQQIDKASAGDAAIAGKVYAINIIGCILGPILVGYFLLPYFGSKWTIFIICLPLIMLIAFFMVHANYNFIFTKLLVITGVIIIVALNTVTYEDGINLQNKIIKRDYSSSVIAYMKADNTKGMLVNGIGITHLTTITKIMAHLPLVLIDNPKQALVICFGMGTTWRSAMSWDIEVTGVELSPSVVELFPYYFSDAYKLLKNKNGQIIVDDGRRFLLRSQIKYDLITIDPPPPIAAAGSSLLYSTDFYKIAKLRLKDNGILMQWIPTDSGNTLSSMAKSIQLSFPYVKVFHSVGDVQGYHFLASKNPIPEIDIDKSINKIPRSAQNDLLEWSNSDESTETIFRALQSNETEINNLININSEPITDNDPKNEYFILKTL